MAAEATSAVATRQEHVLRTVGNCIGIALLGLPTARHLINVAPQACRAHPPMTQMTQLEETGQGASHAVGLRPPVSEIGVGIDFTVCHLSTWQNLKSIPTPISISAVDRPFA
jgi:hypothetical protein